MPNPDPEMNPGDEAKPGTPGTGKDVCQTCHGSGGVDAGACETCGGSGKVIRVIGGRRNTALPASRTISTGTVLTHRPHTPATVSVLPLFFLQP